MRLLRPRIAHYAWGTATDLPSLLGFEATDEPCAEVWVGAHPALPSWLDPGPGTLHDVAPDIPFLLKVLAVGSPLSIQTHPSDAQARAGYARENSLGIGLDAPERTYRDPDGKPELVCALTEFEALCGFRSVSDIASDFEAFGLAAWAHAVQTQSIQQVVGQLLTLPKPEQADLVTMVAAGGPKWLDPVAKRYPSDAGVVVAVMLQHFVLAPGEALVLRPGLLHAYLGGVAAEVMGPSDNVLRGGLTPKYVDVAGLMEVLEPDAKSDLRRAGAIHRSTDGFALTVGAAPSVTGPALVLSIADDVFVGDEPLLRGAAAYIEPGETVRIAGAALTASR